MLLLCFNRVPSVLPTGCVSSTAETIVTVLKTDDLAGPAAEAAEKWHVRYAKRQLRAERRKLLRDAG